MTTANRTELRFIQEVTWGVTPTSPTLVAFRTTGESLNANIQKVVSDEIRGDRNQSTLIDVGSDAGGDMAFELSYTSFDAWLETALCSVWIVDGVDTDKYTLVNGTTEKSFTVQKKLIDIAQYFNFTGVRANTMSLDVMPGKIVTGSFGVMAKDGVRTASQFGGATLPAAGTTTPMNGAAGVTLAQIDAAPISGGLLHFTMNVNNNRRAQKVVGSVASQAIAAGKFEVTGEFEIYFIDGTLYDKFSASTSFAFATKMAGPGTTNEIWIDLPNAQFEKGEVVAQATDTDVMFKASYRALYHTGTAGTVKLTKNGPL